MAVLSEQFQITAPGPDAVMGISAQITGPPGLATYYYWWTANYPIGLSVVSAPLLVRGAPSPLTVANHVTITGQPALGATSYDLLRTNSPQLPSSNLNNIAIAAALPSPTFQDVGNAPIPYDIIGLAAGAPVSEFITLNNRDFAKPTLVLSPFGLASPGVSLTAGGITFPDGSTQTTAGQTPLTVPIWRSYTVTLVGTNWQVTAPDGTVTTVPTAAATTQQILLANLPPNPYMMFAGLTVVAGPVTGTPAARVDGLGTATNPGSIAFFNGDLHNGPGFFLDVNATTGRITENSPEQLVVGVSAGTSNIDQFIPPCSFIVSILWGQLF